MAQEVINTLKEFTVALAPNYPVVSEELGKALAELERLRAENKRLKQLLSN